MISSLTFDSPRPYWVDPRIQALAGAANYGLPSGHACDTALVWLFLARILGRTWAWSLAILLVLIVSFSRIYLGVHFVSDVLGGWAFREAWHRVTLPSAEPIRWALGSLEGAVSGGWAVFLAPWLLARVGIVHEPDTVNDIDYRTGGTSRQSLAQEFR